MDDVLPTYSESVDAIAVARQRLVEDPSLYMAVKAIRSAYLSRPECDSDAIAAAMLIAYSMPQERSQFEKNCQSAILEASMNLGMDPAVLAENCANGEIADLVCASRDAAALFPLTIYSHCAAHCMTVQECDTRMTDALKPFVKE